MNFTGMEQVLDDLAAANARIDARLDALDAELAPLSAAWTGAAFDSVASAIPTDLKAGDFSWIPGGPELFRDYTAASRHLVTYVTTGSETFDGFARRLLQTAQAYMEAEEYTAAELAQVQAEMDAL